MLIPKVLSKNSNIDKIFNLSNVFSAGPMYFDILRNITIDAIKYVWSISNILY